MKSEISDKAGEPPCGDTSHDGEIAFTVPRFIYNRTGFSHTFANTVLPGKLNHSRNTLLVYAVSLVVLSLS